jgi:hypothetical protein
VFNAALGLVQPDQFAREAVGYVRTPHGIFLPIWVAAVANGEYAPLAVGPSVTDAEQASGAPFVFGQTDRAVPPRLFEVHSKEPKLWYALLVLLAVGTGYLIAVFFRARMSTEPRPLPEMWPAEGLFTLCDHGDHILEQNLITLLFFSYLSLFLGGITVVVAIRPAPWSFGATSVFALVGIPAVLATCVSLWVLGRVLAGLCRCANPVPRLCPILAVWILCNLYEVVAYGRGLVPLALRVLVPVVVLVLLVYATSQRRGGDPKERTWLHDRGYHVALFSGQVAFLLCAGWDFARSLGTAGAFDTTTATLVYERWTDLAGGTSAVLPSLFGCGLILVFCVGQLASLRTLDVLEHLPKSAEACLHPLPREARAGGPGQRLSSDLGGPLAFVFHTDAFARSIKEIEDNAILLARWFRRPPQIGLSAILASGVVVLLSIEIRVEPLATLEGRGGDLLFQLTFLVGVTVIAFSLLVFANFSRWLLLLLRALRTHPLAPAYRRVPDPWDKPLDRRLFGPPLDFSEVHMMLPVLEKVVALTASAEPGGPGTTILPREAASATVATKARALFIEASHGNAVPSAVLAPVVAAAQMLYHERRRDWRRKATAAPAVVCDPQDPSVEEALPGSMRAEPSRPPPGAPEGKLWRKFDQSVDVLVASVVSVVISQLIAQYRYLVFVVVGCTLLLSFKLMSYPFAPHGFLTEFLWVGTLVVTASTFAIYAVLRRDPLLALIGQYKPGKVSYNLDLLKWFLTWVAVPTVSAAAVRYPAVFASVSQWLGPLTKP